MLPTQFEAANVRHRQIGDHERGGQVTKSLQRELAIARYAHLIPMSRQAAAQDPRELWLIINDKYALLFFHDGLALQGASYNLPKAMGRDPIALWYRTRSGSDGVPPFNSVVRENKARALNAASVVLALLRYHES